VPSHYTTATLRKTPAKTENSPQKKRERERELAAFQNEKIDSTKPESLIGGPPPSHPPSLPGKGC